MNETKKDLKRQGDLLFIPIQQKPYHLKDEDIRKDGIIREGEATGHHHKLDGKGVAVVYRPQFGTAVVVVGPEDVVVIHPEHGPVTLSANTTYDVHIAREWDIMEGERTVAD